MPEYATNKLATVGTTRDKLANSPETVPVLDIPEEALTALKKYSSLSIKENTDAQYVMINEIITYIHRLIFFIDRDNNSGNLAAYIGNRPGVCLTEDIAWNSVELEVIQDTIYKLGKAIGTEDVIV